jgi:hypothetical protein
MPHELDASIQSIELSYHVSDFGDCLFGVAQDWRTTRVSLVPTISFVSGTPSATQSCNKNTQNLPPKRFPTDRRQEAVNDKLWELYFYGLKEEHYWAYRCLTFGLCKPEFVLSLCR